MRTITPLDSGWTLEPLALRGPAAATTLREGQVIPAQVPGCVHTDLLRAELIPDPYVGTNEQALAWIGESDWTYRTSFEWQPGVGERSDLVFEGLDTVSTVTVNGIEVGRTANMHRSYRFDVGAQLTPGTNQLAVTFASAMEYARAQKAALGARPTNFSDLYPFIRKMACNFGWDWGPALVTAGIWKDCYVDTWSEARFGSVALDTQLLDDGRGVTHVTVEVERTATASSDLILRLSLNGSEASVALRDGDTSHSHSIDIEHPELWWPQGYGNQALYEARVDLLSADGRILETYQRDVGFRRIEIETIPDSEGESFSVIVNGQRVFIRGFNWIPDHCFASSVTVQDYADRLGQAVELGANLVRVWGGGVYASEAMLAECDARGLLVWQDFLFACAAYPEEEPLRSEVREEARENIRNHMSHPSLLLWNGNNENVWFWEDEETFGWKEKLDGLTWGEEYYFTLLPELVQQINPRTSYISGSPWGGLAGAKANDPRFGVTHAWIGGEFDGDFPPYDQMPARFVSEFGYPGPATWSTLQTVLVAEEPSVTNADFANHNKAGEWITFLTAAAEARLTSPVDFDDWLWIAQLAQVRAISAGISHFRSISETCGGTVLWQLNDCWPALSWSAIDSEGRFKPLAHALKRVYADRLLALPPLPDGDVREIVVINDSPDPWESTVQLTGLGGDGDPIGTTTAPFAAGPRSTVRITLPTEFSDAASAAEFLIADADGLRTAHGRSRRTPSSYRPQRPHVSVTEVNGDFQVIVTAETFIRDLTLLPDRVDAELASGSNGVTLMPGETHTFTLVSARKLSLASFEDNRALRYLGDRLAADSAELSG